MSFQLTGTVTNILPMETGQGKNGEWKKQSFVIEFMDGNYPKKVCMTAWKEEVNALKYAKVGDKLTVSFNLESREYNGKWYTDIKAWKIVNGGDENSATTVTKMDTGGSSEPDNDLPF